MGEGMLPTLGKNGHLPANSTVRIADGPLGTEAPDRSPQRGNRRYDGTMSDAVPFIARQEPFICDHCGQSVAPLPRGSYRNHCPHCLWSKHVDERGPGDRAATCQGQMEPVALDYRAGSQSRITHRCQMCKKTIPNVVAPDDDLAQFPTSFPHS